MKPVPAPSDSPVGVPWSPPDPVARARRTVGRLVQSGSACAHLGGSGEGRWLPGWSWGTNSVPGGKNSSLLGDGQGAGSREHPGTLESAQEGLNKVGCPTLWRHPWSWKAKHKELVGGAAWDGAVVSAAREELGGPHYPTPWPGASQLPQQGGAKGQKPSEDEREESEECRGGWVALQGGLGGGQGLPATRGLSPEVSPVPPSWGGGVPATGALAGLEVEGRILLTPV